MDRIESLGNALSQITMYDIKSMYNQAKNVVFNVSEMEAKVRDATNDEPWGASSTLMQEIAQGTFNFQNFNEIMPAIYSRFMEKEAKQWRQIYKALQLLEYLIKNGSERVVDDARSHVGTIKMLRNFYYVDEKGKDQGINVRNRSKELVELLGDVDKIRAERRKAKANKHKYTGTGNDAMSFGSGGGGRYGGFGSESLGYGGGGSGSYSGGGGDSYSGGGYSGRSNYDSYDGAGSSGVGSSSSRRNFQEYDAGDDDYVPRRSNSIAHAASSHAAPSAPQRSSTLPSAPAPEPPKAKEPVVDLLGMDDDAFGSTVSAPAEKALPAPGPSLVGGDDDFDDFQSAPPSAAPAAGLGFTAPAPARAVPTSLPPPMTATSMSPPPMQAQAPASNAGLFNMLGNAPVAQPAQAPMGMGMGMGMGMNAGMGGMGMAAMKPMVASPPPMTPSMGGAPLAPSVMTPSAAPLRTTTASPAASGPAKASANFDDLWSMSLGVSKPATGAGAAGGQKSMKDLEKEKAQASIWGGASQNRPGAGFGGASASAKPASSGNGLDDLLF